MEFFDLRIVGASVLVGDGCDKITLKTDLPCPFPPAFIRSQPSLDVCFSASKGTGIDYVREHFRIDPLVIQL